MLDIYDRVHVCEQILYPGYQLRVITIDGNAKLSCNRDIFLGCERAFRLEDVVLWLSKKRPIVFRHVSTRSCCDLHRMEWRDLRSSKA